MIIAIDKTICLKVLLNKTVKIIFNGLKTEYRRPLTMAEMEIIIRPNEAEKTRVFLFDDCLSLALGYSREFSRPVVDPVSLWNDMGALLVRLDSSHYLTFTPEQYKLLKNTMGILVIMGLASEYLDMVYIGSDVSSLTKQDVTKCLYTWMRSNEFVKVLNATGSIDGHSQNAPRLNISMAVSINKRLNQFMSSFKQNGYAAFDSLFDETTVRPWWLEVQQLNNNHHFALPEYYHHYQEAPDNPVLTEQSTYH